MHDCYKCYYRSRTTLTCDYILIMGKSRGVPAEFCDKFKEREDEEIEPFVLDIQRLYYKGFSDRRISRELGTSRYSVFAWRQSNGLEPNGETQRGRPKRSDLNGCQL